MIKVFISQPMSGRDEQDIINERIEEMGKIRMYFDEEVYILDTYMTNDYMNLLREENAKKNNCLWAEGMEYVFMLGSSITAMAEADVVWFVKGWSDSSGCLHEFDIASESGVRVIMQNYDGSLTDSNIYE